MQCGSRFSVSRCVKTHRLQTTSPSTIEFFRCAPLRQDYLVCVTCRCHTHPARFYSIVTARKNYFPPGTSRPCGAYRSWATILGYDLGLRSGDWCTGAHNPENADIVG